MKKKSKLFYRNINFIVKIYYYKCCTKSSTLFLKREAKRNNTTKVSVFFKEEINSTLKIKGKMQLYGKKYKKFYSIFSTSFFYLHEEDYCYTHFQLRTSQYFLFEYFKFK